MLTAATAPSSYKGKVTNRSWPQLPEELVRHIATFFLWDLSATGYSPETWETREFWYNRLVFTTLRDANDLERHMMEICPQWHVALQNHFFWQKAVTVIDPNDVLAHCAIVHPKTVSLNSSTGPAQPTRFTPYRHFRNITNCSCFVCRINSPLNNLGLTTAKSAIYTPYLQRTHLCRDHTKRAAAFCGLCLRDAPVYENVTASSDALTQFHAVAVVENEDRESFPNVEATCRRCRMEWLWRRASDNPRDREAIGGRTLCSDDWETRSTVEQFIDLAEGCIKEILLLAREKHWLRNNTRMTDMLEQALAASRYNRSRSYDDDDDEEEEEDDEEMEAMQLEENGVRELALNDWARLRIMDGHWFSPADFWYNSALPGKPMHVRAIHPCPWSREVSRSPISPLEEEEEEEHPTPSTVKGEIPPTFILCEQAFQAHQRQLRVVLTPAMRNLVRKIVIECTTPGLGVGIEDPAIRAARMTLEDVLTELREEEGIWFDGFDWAERGLNHQLEREKRERDASGDDSSTASSGGRSSNATSPVLSTSTLQTTPSPPPIPLTEKEDVAPEREQEREKELSSVTLPVTLDKPVTIPIAPVLHPPRLLPSIPYIPVTATHFPQYTMDALKQVWREACSPLYHCRCRICQRASAKANAANGNVQHPHQQAPPSSPTSPQEQTLPPVIVIPPQAQKQTQSAPVRSAATKGAQEAAPDADGEDELEIIEVDDTEEGTEDLEDVEEFIVSGSEDEDWRTPASVTPQNAPLPPPVLRVRKRSSDEIDLEGEDEQQERIVLGKGEPGGTPPKRARRDEPGGYVSGGGLLAPAGKERPALPRRIRKRSSEEVQELSEEEGNKRVKVSPRTGSDLELASPLDGATSDGLVDSPPPSIMTDLSRASSASLSS